MEVLQWLKNNLPGKRQRDYLIRGGLWITAEQAVTMAIGIIFGILLVRILSQTDYGTYKFFFSFFAILQIFLFNGMNAAVLQATGQGDIGAFSAIVRFRLRWMPLFACAAGSAALYYAIRHEYTLSFSFLIIAVLHPITAALNTYQSYLQGMKKFGCSVVSSSLTQCIVTSAMLITLVMTQSLVMIVAAYAVTNVLMNIFFFLFFRVPAPEKKQTNAIRYGKHLTLMDILGTISQQLDQLLLFFIGGPAVLAYYAIAQLFPSLIYNFLKSLSVLLIPVFAPKKISEITKHFYPRLAVMLVIGIGISVAYAAVAPTLFKWFFPRYIFLVGYTQLIALDLIWALPVGFIGSIFTAQKLLRASYGSPLAANAVRIMLYFLLGITYGLQGMIIAYLISRAIGIAINIGFWEYERRRANF